MRCRTDELLSSYVVLDSPKQFKILKYFTSDSKSNINTNRRGSNDMNECFRILIGLSKASIIYFLIYEVSYVCS